MNQELITKNLSPSISVIIPLYNKRETIARAISSVLKQSFTGFELIVVDDGSTDESPSVVGHFVDPRIRLIHQPNGGVSSARNRGVKESSADLVAFLDADDEWMPGHLSTILHLRNSFPECAVFTTRYLFGTPGGTTRLCTIQGLPPEWKGVIPNYFSLAAMSDPPIHTSSVAATRQAITDVGLFPVGVAVGEDLLTWARLAVRFKVAYTMTPSAIFWQAAPHVYGAPPNRIPHPDDPVGLALEKLLRECPPSMTASFRQYLSLWHKMRASMYIRLGQRGNGLKETCVALHHNPLSLRLYVYLLLLVLPTSIQSVAFRALSTNAEPHLNTEH